MSTAVSSGDIGISLPSPDDQPRDTNSGISAEFHLMDPEEGIIEPTSISTSIKILVTGKFGCGKTALVSGIIGQELPATSLEPGQDQPKELTVWQRQLDDVNVTVWDTPGLQDGTDAQEGYLQQMRDQCSARDLSLYCINISQTRFTHTENNPDVAAMKKLTAAFGKRFWEDCVIVLTYANALQAFNLDWNDLPQHKKEEWFKKRIDDWKAQVRNILFGDIGLSKERSDTIKIVPAGHFARTDLPGIKYWFSILWHECTNTIRSPTAREALKKVNKRRIKTMGQVKPADFDLPIQNQPIIEISHPSPLEVFGGGVLGGITGSAIGMLGLVAGPPAVAVTLPVGALVGTVVGLGGAATGYIPVDKVKDYLPGLGRK